MIPVSAEFFTLFMTSTRPYLLRALYEWIVDNNMTPFLLVNTTITGVSVPKQYVEDNRIILNISPAAVHQLEIHNDAVSFDARFNNRPVEIYVPVAAVVAIYAKETGDGLSFTADMELAADSGNDKFEKKGNSNKVNLKVIK